MEFDLVLIAEKFEESLVLLAYDLCLDLKQVAYLHLNKRPKDSLVKQKRSLNPRLYNKNRFQRARLSSSEVKLLKEWQAGDETLYKHFKAKLDKRIRGFGVKEMEEKVSELQEYVDQLRSECQDMESTFQRPRVITSQYMSIPSLQGYNANYDWIEKRRFVCKFMLVPEISIVNGLRRRQEMLFKKLALKGGASFTLY